MGCTPPGWRQLRPGVNVQVASSGRPSALGHANGPGPEVRAVQVTGGGHGQYQALPAVPQAAWGHEGDCNGSFALRCGCRCFISLHLRVKERKGRAGEGSV